MHLNQKYSDKFITNKDSSVNLNTNIKCAHLIHTHLIYRYRYRIELKKKGYDTCLMTVVVKSRITQEPQSFPVAFPVCVLQFDA